MWNQLYIKSDFWGATQGRQKDVVDMSNLLADSFFIYTSGKKPHSNFSFGVELQANLNPIFSPLDFSHCLWK